MTLQPETAKKLSILAGVIFLLLMIGPYFGIHLFGRPTLPDFEPSGSAASRSAPFLDDAESLPLDSGYDSEEEINYGEDQQDLYEDG